MNRWFVVHDLLAFEQHPDMICNVVKKTGIAEPKFFIFGQIQKGDLIAYYATEDLVVVGIFRVVSDIQYVRSDPYWEEVMVFKIEPFKLPPNGNYLDFKKLVTTPTVYFDMFPEKTHWGNYLQGKTCVSLSDKDYFTIEKAVIEEKYMKSREQIKIKATEWHDRYGKALEHLVASLSDTEKRTLRAIMSLEEEGSGLVSERDLVLLLTRQEMHLLDNSLKELRRKRLLRFMGRRRGQRRFSLTRRGRTLDVLVRRQHTPCGQSSP